VPSRSTESGLNCAIPVAPDVATTVPISEPEEIVKLTGTPLTPSPNASVTKTATGPILLPAAALVGCVEKWIADGAAATMNVLETTLAPVAIEAVSV